MQTSYLIIICVLLWIILWMFTNNKQVIYIRKRSIRNRIDKIEKDLHFRYETIKERLEKEYEEKNNNIDNIIRIRKNELEHYYKDIYEKKTNELLRSKEDNIKYLQKEKEQLEGVIAQKNGKIEELKQAIYGVSPFSKVAAMAADYQCFWFDNNRHYLINRNRPARKAAEVVADVKTRYRELLFEFKQMRYKYDFLLSTFPDLKTYIDDEQALLHLSDYDNYNQFDTNRDRVHDWLSDEEFKVLSSTERNQLALDRYKNRNKTNWEIGVEYELFVGHKFRMRGYEVTQFGEINGVEDLGRDLIVKKEGKTYIVQCKRWSENRQLHENVICQLFGTTLEYKIKNNLPDNAPVYPLICSTTKLSPTAIAFAQRLGVIVRILPMGDYPMIKCNIGNIGEKIYHLPFDQQYHRTLINSSGEFYAYTVAEAEEHGFRRAFRHFAN